MAVREWGRAVSVNFDSAPLALMNRVFGTTKAKVPKATLADAINSVRRRELIEFDILRRRILEWMVWR